MVCAIKQGDNYFAYKLFDKLGSYYLWIFTWK